MCSKVDGVTAPDRPDAGQPVFLGAAQIVGQRRLEDPVVVVVDRHGETRPDQAGEVHPLPAVHRQHAEQPGAAEVDQHGVDLGEAAGYVGEAVGAQRVAGDVQREQAPAVLFEFDDGAHHVGQQGVRRSRAVPARDRGHPQPLPAALPLVALPRRQPPDVQVAAAAQAALRLRRRDDR